MSQPHPATGWSQLNISSLPIQPWKNGGGTTRELLCSPPNADYQSFDWRISLAHVQTAGDFSRFPGIDRHIVLIEGDSMPLLQGEQVHVLHPFKPYSFAGEDPVACLLPQGPTKDLNLMLLRGRAHGSLQTWQGHHGSETLAAGTHLFYLAQGNYQLQADSQRWILSAGQILTATLSRPLPLDMQAGSADAALIHACITQNGTN